MTKREFTSIVLKLMGVYVLVQSLQLLQYLGYMVNYGQREGQQWYFTIMVIVSSLIPFIVIALAGLLLLFYNNKIVTYIIRDDGQMDITGQISADEFQAIGFSIIAVYVFLHALPNMIPIISNLLFAFIDDQYVQPHRSSWYSLLAVGIQVGLSIFLFFRSVGLVNFWRRIQVGRYVKLGESPDEVKLTKSD